MKKSSLFLISILTIGALLVGCGNDEQKDEVETDQKTEVTDNDEVDSNQKTEEVNNEDVEDTVLTKTDEELIEIGRNLIRNADQIYVVKTEEEVHNIIDTTFSSVEFFTDVFMDILDPNTPYVKIETKFSNESIRRENINFYYYTATTVTNKILEDGNIGETKTDTSIYHIVRTENGDYKIFLFII